MSLTALCMISNPSSGCSSRSAFITKVEAKKARSSAGSFLGTANGTTLAHQRVGRTLRQVYSLKKSALTKPVLVLLLFANR